MNRRGWNEASTRAARKVNGLRESAGNRASVAGSAVHLFDAEPMMHPNVLDAYKQAARVLKKKRIQFRETGGIALNLRGAGRPTKDIDLVVRRSDWLRAIQAVSEIATDRPGIRFGLPQKPEAGLAVIGPHGVPIELWPEGTTHEQIARIRGMQKGRAHPAGKLAFTLRGDATVAFINDKLASYLSARDRLRDAADVQSLITRLKLPLGFAKRLATAVRPAYRRLWVKQAS
ncbi:MAG TPA: hypothetical protein VG146_19995 [Verrucomicrobiae bacterium]|nr:hypothetical protein [Verrucomicrobiae bacterium]